MGGRDQGTAGYRGIERRIGRCAAARKGGMEGAVVLRGVDGLAGAVPDTTGIAERGTAPPPAMLSRIVGQAGVVFNGDRPWDIQVYDGRFYERVRHDGSLGLGETYLEGMWESNQLDETMTRLIRIRAQRRLKGLVRLRRVTAETVARLLNWQSRRRAFQVGKRHYDIGNDLYRAMLDTTMSYSCGYWKDADDLEAAQRAKLDLICRKLALSPGERLLDIGCGWGGLLEHAARHHGIEGVGITVSREQQRLARERCRGLPVEIRLMDYRELDGRFDKVVSVGMFEHVGPRNHATFFATASRLLDGQGLLLLHTIGDRTTHYSGDPWIDRYVFPNGVVPSARQVTSAFEPWFVLEDWHNFGSDYDRTLMAWWRNFASAWPRLESESTRYDARFYRLWKYYLHACAAYFRAREGQLWQVVLSGPHRAAGYVAQR